MTGTMIEGILRGGRSAASSPAAGGYQTLQLGTYPGSKALDGVLHRIIGEMPEHQLYVEAFLGHGAVLRAKRPASSSIGIDVDAQVIARWGEPAGVLLRCLNAVDWLADHVHFLGRDSLVYCDPPYLASTRTRLFYRHEFARPEQHRSLLAVLKQLRCFVMISGYPSRLYDRELRGWRRIQYRCMTRGGPRTECLWMNFGPPRRLHDPRFAGDGFRERERVKRKKQRWASRFAAMEAFERQLVREQLNLVDSAESAMPAADFLKGA